MNSCWNENLIIFIMELVSTCSDSWIKIWVFGAYPMLTPNQTWSNLLKIFVDLEFDIKPWKMLFCEDFDLVWPLAKVDQGYFGHFGWKSHFERSDVWMGCATPLYMFSWPMKRKWYFWVFQGPARKSKVDKIWYQQQVVKVYHAINSFLAKFFKSL